MVEDLRPKESNLFGQLFKSHSGRFAFLGAEDVRETVAQQTSVFILSSQHSGSTWVGYVLGSGPESAFVGEYSRAWDETARVPCTLCAARGLRACEVLYDIEIEPADKALDLAFARLGKRVIIDSSKDLRWTQRLQNSANVDIKIVHLVRDPRGVFASVKRRGQTDLSAAMTLWCKENREFQDFVDSSRISGIVAGYDVLASAPESEFHRLYEFCGMRFARACLRYWTVAHHGFAANGASDAIVKGGNFPHVPGHFLTGDDSFYGEHSRKPFHDQRWRAALTTAERRAIETDPETRQILDSLNFAFAENGLSALRNRSR